MAPPLASLLESLPQTLRERVRVLSHGRRGSRAAANGGRGDLRYVLYWMHHGMRGDENPALELAVHAGNQWNLPVLVFQELADEAPYASDRHHTFVLEGARELQRQFKSRGLGCVVTLSSRGQRGQALRELAVDAPLVVTEEMPVAPYATWVPEFAEGTAAAVACVDSACIVPMQTIESASLRAYQFRERIQGELASRLSAAPRQLDAPRVPWADRPLPVASCELADCDLAALVASRAIDHSIPPVGDTVGGGGEGYRRWERFADTLPKYDRLRNNPLVSGTSRLSAYLHYGMVAPQRIAREAFLNDSAGARKFLDELLVWRELAYVFCFHHPDHARFSALPEWAQATLAEHQEDPRSESYSWESLARGVTRDALWNAAQQSLIRKGELHNNVRMTWGKALLEWSETPELALALLIDLNHRFALDGRDPASYGGILWCLGQFDRPCPPPRPVLGTVRGRSPAEHARRLDVSAYRRRVSVRPRPVPTVAVVGAGISGLCAARHLHDQGVTVRVFEKSRGPAGRCATRRAPDGVAVDHGAQYFTARDPRFRRYVDSWLYDEVIAPWEAPIGVLEQGHFQPKDGPVRYVGLPAMNQIGKHLARELDVSYQTRVAPIRSAAGSRWGLSDDQGTPLGEFDYVLLAVPAPQAAELLEHGPPDLVQRVRGVPMTACWAAMVCLAPGVSTRVAATGIGGAFVNRGPLRWVARNNSKPGRQAAPESWVLHASPEWTDTRLDASAEEVLPQLLEAFWEALGESPDPLPWAVAHRWRYALSGEPVLEENPVAEAPVEEAMAADAGTLVVAGDWCAGSRVEGAWLSGMAAAGRVMSQVITGDRAAESGTARQRKLF